MRGHRGTIIGALACAGALLPSGASATPQGPGDLINPLFEPVACENCHLFENPPDQDMEPSYAPFRTWQGSLMANAARDPVFWAGVAVADQDIPGETELCIRCHSPRAFLDGNQLATSIDDLTDAQLGGVECMLCHRMVEDLPVPAGNAAYTLDDIVPAGETNVPRRGPWDFTDGVPEPPHAWINDPYVGTSRACGTCHDVTTPVERVDDAGDPMGVNFNEQRTYSEWLGSAFAIPGAGFASCQDCHMAPVDDMAGCTAHAGVYSHETGGRRHDLVGANRFVVQLLKDEYGSLGENTIGDFFFDTTMERLDEFVQTAATLEVAVPAEVNLGDGLSGLDVLVTNNTGHKLPSGYSEGRIMWLEVSAEYAGDVLWTSGTWDQDAGTIEEDDQLRSYEGVGQEYETGTTFHLLLNNYWAVDNRIPPLGLQPNIETDPVGDRYTLLPSGEWPNYDEHGYTFDGIDGIEDATPDDQTDDTLVVRVRLLYLINTPEYIEFLGNEGEQAGEDVADRFELAGGAPPVVLGEQTLAIPIVGFEGADTSTGPGDSSSTTNGTTTGPPATTGTTAPATTMTTQPPTTADTGSDTDETVGQTQPGGCSCRSDTPPVWSWLSLPFLALGLRRRR